MQRLAMMLLLPTATILPPAEGGELPPLPPPLPWHIDAYIGFERIAEMGPVEDDEQWYWQNALQVDGTQIKLHRQLVVCTKGKLWSVEGDGREEFFEGSFEGIRQRTVSLRYLKCEGCLWPEKRPVQLLELHELDPDTIRMGDVVYSRKLEPYPAQCPVVINQASAEAPAVSAPDR